MSWIKTFAAQYASGLLNDESPDCKNFLSKLNLDHPALSWRRCGAMSQTGLADGQALMSPAPLSACADGAFAAFQYLASHSVAEKSLPVHSIRGSILLGERAQYTGWTRAGDVTLGSACRLLECADGYLAINLPRDEDWPLAQAWLEHELSGWDEVAELIRNKNSEKLIGRARELGLAVSTAEPLFNTGSLPVLDSLEESLRHEKKTAPLVIDLSVLWAGPLAASLLQHAGARVIKVESEQRLDGAREGNKEFYEMLNQGKETLLLDLKSKSGITALSKLIQQADIVIESSRPRALKQLGIDADQCVANNPEMVWLSITAYGRQEPNANWIGFGDDVGVAAGLSTMLQELTGETIFCGDAIADPLTGVHAALYAYHQHLSGNGGVLDVAMHAVVRHCIESAVVGESEYAAWSAIANADAEDLYALREVYAGVEEAGAQTEKILNEFNLS